MDVRILPAAEVVVYGKEKIPGIILTKPRELMTKEERERHLRATLLLSYEHTLKDLLSEGAPIDEDTIRARNELLVEAEKEAR